MRYEAKTVLAGIAMILAGIVLFYSNQPGQDGVLPVLRHAGTFIGLMGIGVLVAGILLWLISRNQSQLQMD